MFDVEREISNVVVQIRKRERDLEAAIRNGKKDISTFLRLHA